MTFLETIDSRMAEETKQRGQDQGLCVVGTALAVCFQEEQAAESKRIRSGQTKRTEAEFLRAYLDRLDKEWSALSMAAEQALTKNANANLAQTMSECLKEAKEPASSRVRFAIWTGVAANFAWLLVTATLAFFAFLAVNDWSPPKALTAFTSIGRP